MYADKEYLALSGIQHFAFCRRQWALIHIEQKWQENYLTASGQVTHKRAHDLQVRERRGSLLTVRNLYVSSPVLGLAGMCDVVEFRANAHGVPIHGEEGLWLPVPIEYKRGRLKGNNCDELQVCAQAMCLEEMLGCTLDTGFLFYKQTNKREPVELNAQLRGAVIDASREMHKIFDRGYVPRVKARRACKSCSLVDECKPDVQECSAGAYVEKVLGSMT